MSLFGWTTYSLLDVEALLLRDLVCFTEDDRGGGVGIGLSFRLGAATARSVLALRAAFEEELDM